MYLASLVYDPSCLGHRFTNRYKLLMIDLIIVRVLWLYFGHLGVCTCRNNLYLADPVVPNSQIILNPITSVVNILFDTYIKIATNPLKPL